MYAFPFFFFFLAREDLLRIFHQSNNFKRLQPNIKLIEKLQYF